MTPLASIPRLDSGPTPQPKFEDPVENGGPVDNTVAMPVAERTAVETPTTPAAAVAPLAPSTNTFAAWVIAALPVLQFAILFLVFGALGQEFPAGSQWGILAAPAIVSLVFALFDRRILVGRGFADAPSVVWAIIPPLYLIVRCVRFGRSALIPLIVWIVLQVASAAATLVLLPKVISGITGTE